MGKEDGKISLGQRLRIARIRAGFRQLAAAAHELGVSRVTLSNWERDFTDPSDENWESIGRVYRVRISEIRYPDEQTWEPAPDTSSNNGIELSDYVGNLERIQRTLKTYPGGDAGRALKVGFLDMVERAARETGNRLPAEYWQIRRRVHEGEL